MGISPVLQGHLVATAGTQNLKLLFSVGIESHHSHLLISSSNIIYHPDPYIIYVQVSSIDVQI